LTLRRMTRKDSIGLGPRFEPELRRLAGQLLYRGGDPRSYMQYVFDQAAEHGSDITYPRILFSNEMVNRFFLARVTRRDELELLARLQAHTLEARLNDGRSMEDILRDPREELSAVFRFLVAHLSKLTELENELRDDATMMLDYEPLYREVYGKWLPEELKNAHAAT
jgi:hypothetical protein